MSVPIGVESQYAAFLGKNRRTAHIAVALVTPAMNIQNALPIARNK